MPNINEPAQLIQIATKQKHNSEALVENAMNTTAHPDVIRSANLAVSHFETAILLYREGEITKGHDSFQAGLKAQHQAEVSSRA